MSTFNPASFFFSTVETTLIALIAAVITLLIAYLILKVLVTIVKHDLHRRRVPMELVGILSTALTAFFWYFVLMAILSVIGDFEMILSMGIIFAFFVLAAGLALSGVLKELVSGAFLATDKDYRTGLKVKVAGVEGVVESVDIRRVGSEMIKDFCT
ncbi:MAG: mechanosensitive ion channel domain-containing protein [Nitrososphaerales archaeon]